MKSLLLKLLVILLLVAACFTLSDRFKNQNLAGQNTQAAHSAYFMQSEFYGGIIKPDKVDAISEKVYGGIVSHHFYMEREIAKFFAQLGGQNPPTIVIIGPNHFNSGSAEILVSKYAYKTPWGELEPDIGAIDKLLLSGIVKNQEQPFEREHSISTLVGFVKHRFPAAKFVALILKRNLKMENVEALAKKLNEILPEDSLVIASVDFSHHVTNQVAQKQDEQSLKLLQGFDFLGIAKRTPEEMDSPASINTLLKYLELRGAKAMRYKNTNQALVSGNLNNPDVTSYFFAYFTKGRVD